MYLIIDEDCTVYTTEVVSTDILEAYESGIVIIVDVGVDPPELFVGVSKEDPGEYLFMNIPSYGI